MTSFLQVTNVTWGPSPSRPIIENISFDVTPGSVTVIVGANGAGKSTLLRCIYRVQRPQQGQIWLDGEDIWRQKPQQVARKIAAVLQETPSDFPFTVREVVAMGRTPHLSGFFSASSGEEIIVNAMIERLELRQFAERPFAGLSGGEKQRALLARALVQEPGLLILDEPTNHLDIRHQLEILAELRQLEITVLATLHDLGLAASIADQIVVMHQGKIIAAGAPQHVLTSTVIARAFAVEAQIDKVDGELRFAFSLPQRNVS